MTKHNSSSGQGGCLSSFQASLSPPTWPLKSPSENIATQPSSSTLNTSLRGWVLGKLNFKCSTFWYTKKKAQAPLQSVGIFPFSIGQILFLCSGLSRQLPLTATQSIRHWPLIALRAGRGPTGWRSHEVTDLTQLGHVVQSTRCPPMSPCCGFGCRLGPPRWHYSRWCGKLYCQAFIGCIWNPLVTYRICLFRLFICVNWQWLTWHLLHSVLYILSLAWMHSSTHSKKVWITNKRAIGSIILICFMFNLQ